MPDDSKAIPKKGGDKEKLRHHRDAFFDRESSFRRELEDEDFYRPCAYYEGHQWLQKPKGDSRRAPRFTDWKEDDPTPRPVSNEVMPAVDNEVSRVARRNSDFEVSPRGSDADAKAGARLGQELLRDHNDTIGWARIRRDYWFHKILYGTGVLVSRLSTSYRQDKTVRIGVSGALRCVGVPGGMGQIAGVMMPMPGKPSCGCALASKAVPLKKAEDMIATEGMVSDRMVPTFDPNSTGEPKGYDAVRCPGCGGRLESYEVPLDEAEGEDFFGRPLGKDVPLQEATVETTSPWEMFFENEGRGVTQDTCTEWGIERVRSLKWIREHFNQNLDEIQPDEPMKIMERFPFQGEYGSANRGAWSTQAGSRGQRQLYQNHAVVQEFLSDPDRDNPKGRYYTVCGLDKMVILEDGDLMEEDDEGNLFPKVLVRTGRCFQRDNTIWGKGFAAYVISDQNRINMRLSQIVELAERMGIIAITATRGMRLTREWLKSLVGTILRWEPDPAVPNAEPDIKTGQLQFSEWMQEIAEARQSLKERLGINDVETGNLTQSGLKSGVALQIASEKTSERRQQREQEGVKVFEDIQSHQLKLIQHYYLPNEGRKYKAKLGNAWEEREFKGADIAGQTDVKVKEMPGFDETLAGKQTLIESVTAGQIQIMTPYAKREYAKAIGAPTGVMDEENLQIEAAEGKFNDWRRLGELPTIDSNLDNHQVHWDTYGRLMLDHESVEMAKAVGWPKALDLLAGWDRGLPGAQMLASQLSDIADASGKSREETWQIQQTTFAKLGRVPPPTGTPPPEALAPLIWWIWQNRLVQRGMFRAQQAAPSSLPMPPMLGMAPPPPKPAGPAVLDIPPEFERFAKFQAIREAHRLYAQGMAQQQAAGQQPVDAPASPEEQPQPGGTAPGLEAPQMTQQPPGMVQ